jgi:hypothetical protein
MLRTYVRVLGDRTVALTHATSTPAMPSDPQRQVPGFTTGRLPHRDPHGSLRNARHFPQVLCRVVGSGSYQRGMWASVTQRTSCAHAFLSFSRQYGSAAFRYSDEQARSTRRFTNSHNTSTRSIPTSMAGSSWRIFTRRPTSRFPSCLNHRH